MAKQDKTEKLKHEIDILSREILSKERKTQVLIRKEIALEKRYNRILSQMISIEKGKIAQMHKKGQTKTQRMKQRIQALERKKTSHEERKKTMKILKQKRKLLEKHLLAAERRVRAEASELYKIKKTKEAHKKAAKIKLKKAKHRQKLKKTKRRKRPAKKTAVKKHARKAAPKKRARIIKKIVKKKLLPILKKKPFVKPFEKKQFSVPEKKQVIRPFEKKPAEKKLLFGPKKVQAEAEHIEVPKKEAFLPKPKMPEKKPEPFKAPEPKKIPFREKAESKKYSDENISVVYPDWPKNTSNISSEVALKDGLNFFDLKKIPAKGITLEEFVAEYIRNLEKEPGFEILTHKKIAGLLLLEYTASQGIQKYLTKAMFILQRDIIYKIAFKALKGEFPKINSLFLKTRAGIKIH